MIAEALTKAEAENTEPTLWTMLDGVTGPNLGNRNSKIFQFNLASSTEFSRGSSVENLGEYS